MMRQLAAFCVRWIFPSVAIATGLFILNHTAVISGAIAPPAGYVPQYVLRNIDMCSYLNWMEAGRHRWLVPNYGAPWLTPDELFTPILTLMGHLSNALPWTTLADYYLMHFALTAIAAALLLALFRYFLPSRKQRLLTI